jgi:hypothetical protein
LSLKHQLPALTDEGLLMGEGIGNTELVPKQVDESPELGHRHSVCASVFPQETGLDELGPGDQPIASRLKPNHRFVRLASVLAPVQPVVQGRLRHPKQPGCFSLAEHLPLKHARGRHG